MRSFFTILIITIATISFSQDNEVLPFKPYSYGQLPKGYQIDSLQHIYKSWKSKYVTEKGCPRGRRVLFDDMVHTVSEGIGYGMLLAAYFEDRKLLDDLWEYYQAFPNRNGLMHWKIDNHGNVAGQNAATDAEEDVTFALIVAYTKWKEEDPKGAKRYLRDARKMLSIMYYQEVELGTYVLKPGDMWGGSSTTNISYYAPAYYRIFAEVGRNKSWLKVMDKSYEIIFKAWNEETGLVPDWCTAEGETPAANVGWARHEGKAYLYDAARTPWRISLDYLWFGDERAKKYCDKVSGFIHDISTFRIRDGYQLDGERIGENHTSTFVGTFGVGLLSGKKEHQDDNTMCFIDNLNTKNNNYFNDTLRLLTLLVQTGNFLPPQEFME